MNRAPITAKIRANYTCQECGSTEYIQAHHVVPKDDRTLVCLCGLCHSRKHPDVPAQLFFLKSHQPYWRNKSAATLAKQWGVCSRTVIRAAKRIGIPIGILRSQDEETLRRNVKKANRAWKLPQSLRNGQTNPNTLLTVAEAVTMFHLHENTIRRYLKNRDLSGIQLGGRWRIPWHSDNKSDNNFPELCKPPSC